VSLLRQTTSQLFRSNLHDRKTDQCGVITFGPKVLSQRKRLKVFPDVWCQQPTIYVHHKDGGYDNVEQYISIAQPMLPP